jgi:hypothetical protein
MGRKKNDVFVLGDESLNAEPIGVRDFGSERAVDEEDRTGELPAPDARGVGVPAASTSSTSRRLAVLGLGAGAAAVIAGSALFADTGSHRIVSPPTTSVVSAPPPSVATPSVAVPDAHVRPHHRPKPKSGQSGHHSHSKPEREPTIDEAPVSSAVDVPAPVTISPPPSAPPPLQSGGASGGREEFGFER